MLRHLFALLLLASSLFAFAGCSTPDPDRVSSIPWNRPEKWEGQGPLGGMTPGSR
jgi:hypothetical protein